MRSWGGLVLPQAEGPALRHLLCGFCDSDPGRGRLAWPGPCLPLHKAECAQSLADCPHGAGPKEIPPWATGPALSRWVAGDQDSDVVPVTAGPVFPLGSRYLVSALVELPPGALGAASGSPSSSGPPRPGPRVSCLPGWPSPFHRFPSRRPPGWCCVPPAQPASLLLAHCTPGKGCHLPFSSPQGEVAVRT